MQKTQPLYCWEGVFIAPLHSNGGYSIVACVFVAAGMCLPSRYLVMNIYSDFTVPAFGRSVTIYRVSWCGPDLCVSGYGLCWALVNTVMNLQVPFKAVYFIIVWAISCFSRGTLLHSHMKWNWKKLRSEVKVMETSFTLLSTCHLFTLRFTIPVRLLHCKLPRLINQASLTRMYRYS
jgi:hypothetical protein